MRSATKVVIFGMGFVAFIALGQFVHGQASLGRIWAWGYNPSGQCNVPSPQPDFVMVSANAGWHSLGLKPDGSIVAWGGTPWGDDGQCNIPAPNSGFMAVSAGGYHSLGLKSDGSIVAWGHNYYGQCSVPAPNSGFIAISAGGFHSLGLKSDGSIVAWGYNLDGQLTVPAPNSGFVAISAGGYHSLGLRPDGSIAAWGQYPQYDYGECDVPSPNSGFTAIAAGVCHSLAIRSDGSVAAWGRNGDGQCNVPQPNSGFIAVAGGCQHSLGLKSDGSVVAWGLNDNGQCVAPTERCFVAISAGAFFSLAIEGYVYEGFLSPVDNYSVNKAHAGQTIPIIWRITDKDGSPISDPASFTSVRSFAVDCESYADDPTSIVDEPAAGSSGLQYLGDGLWQYNWKTSKLYKGHCRILKLTLSDHSVHTATFSFQ